MKVEMYSKTHCPYCSRAVAILNRHNVNYIEYEISKDPVKRTQMINRTNGASTVPQIFINDELIGGGDELLDMHLDGRLDVLLKDKLSA